jgi:hypothetical protein
MAPPIFIAGFAHYEKYLELGREGAIALPEFELVSVANKLKRCIIYIWWGTWSYGACCCTKFSLGEEGELQVLSKQLY